MADKGLLKYERWKDQWMLIKGRALDLHGLKCMKDEFEGHMRKKFFCQ